MSVRDSTSSATPHSHSQGNSTGRRVVNILHFCFIATLPPRQFFIALAQNLYCNSMRITSIVHHQNTNTKTSNAAIIAKIKKFFWQIQIEKASFHKEAVTWTQNNESTRKKEADLKILI